MNPVLDSDFLKRLKKVVELGTREQLYKKDKIK